MRRVICLLIISALAISSLSGCASKYGAQKTAVQYYPACYRPIADLRSHENDVNKGAGGGALVGALGGALIGLLASGGKWQGAVAGAAVGGASGAIAGGMYAQSQKEREDNMRLASYLQNLDGDISNLDVAGAAARASLQCYDQAFNALLTQIRARTISRQAAAQRYGEIISGREEAIAILGHAVDNGRNLNQQYEQAFLNEERQINAPQPAVAPDKPARVRKTQALQTARQKKQVLTRKTSDLAREREEAQMASARQTREINEAMANLQDIRS